MGEGNLRGISGEGGPLGKTAATGTLPVAVIHGIVSGIFKDAIRDRRLNANPCEGTKLPKQPVKLVVPPTTEQVNILKAEVPDRYRALVVLAAGTGLRQGEVLGLTLDRLRGVFPVGDRTRDAELIVDQQLVRVGSKNPVFGPPKTEASYRTLPLPKAGWMRSASTSRPTVLVRRVWCSASPTAARSRGPHSRRSGHLLHERRDSRWAQGCTLSGTTSHRC